MSNREPIAALTMRLRRQTKMTENPELNKSLQVQLVEMNQRARTHMGTLWQMPMAYLGIIAVAVGRVEPKHQSFVSWMLLAAGAGALWAMVGSYEGTRRSVGNIRDIEDKLGLQKTAEWHPGLGPIPGFFLVVVGMVGCIVALVAP